MGKFREHNEIVGKKGGMRDKVPLRGKSKQEKRKDFSWFRFIAKIPGYLSSVERQLGTRQGWRKKGWH